MGRDSPRRHLPLIDTDADPKPLLRAEMKKRRAYIAGDNPLAGDRMAEAAATAFDAADSWPDKKRIVAGYWPIQSEINPFPLLQAFEDRGYRLALPCLISDASSYRMIFRRFRLGDDLMRGPFDIRQPREDKDEAEPGVVLLPLLAFDSRGYRLGYGGGYYDRALAILRARRKLTAFGVAFSAQQLAEIPVEAHDQRLDGVITETGLVGLAP